MSIFTKVSLLFVASLLLMLFVSNKSDKITQEMLESLLTQKYIQISDELFTSFSNSDMETLNTKLRTLNLKHIDNTQEEPKIAKLLYQYNTPLSSIKIIKDKKNYLLLYLEYLDEKIILKEITQDKRFQEIAFVNYLILADILVLVALLLMILKMIYPLKRISKDIKQFGEGEYTKRIEVKSKDEIAEVADTFNAMASNLEELIVSRQRLLRDIGHELKTPISKSKLALAMVEPSSYKNIIEQALRDVDEMIDDLLHLEKLNANQSSLHIEYFHAETLVSRALSKLYLEDESLIEVRIEENFSIEADLNYLSIAIKNLIDNGLKYGVEKPIVIESKNRTIFVKSKGEKLEKPLAYYCDFFTQGDNSRGSKGYGLGLSIVKMIVQKHQFELFYRYKEGYNLFSINLTQT